MAKAEELQGLRDEVEQVSLEIVRLLGKRMELVARIAEAKKKLGEPLVDFEVERRVRSRLSDEARKLGISEELVNKITTLMLQESVKLQEAGEKPKRQVSHFDIFRRARELEAEGKRVVRLEVGEPDLGAPGEVAGATAEAVKQGRSRYSDAKGIAELRKKLAEYLSNKYNTEVKAENLILTPGGRFAIYLTMRTTLNMGDEIIIIDPSWPMYKNCAEFLGVRPVVVNTSVENGWLPNVDEVAEKITQATRAIVLNYPCNPTGKVIDRRTFRKLLDIARENNLYVISDEVYADYSFSEYPPSVLEYEDDRFIRVSSFSKSWGMTGYRVGYVTASRELVEKMAKINGMLITCVPEFIQYGCLKALELEETVRRYAEIMKKRMEAAVNTLSKIPATVHKPEGGMYVFPRINVDGLDSIDFAFDLLEKKHVALAPGTVFGDYSNYIRISLGASEEDIRRGIELIGEYLQENVKT